MIRIGLVLAVFGVVSGCAANSPGPAEQRVLRSIAQLCATDGRPPGVSCEQAVAPADARRSVIEWHPQALQMARAADRVDRPQSVLHGWPLLLKANIDTADGLQTTAGALPMAGFVAAADAPLVANLREAGLIVVGKTNLSEWANFRSTESVSGWSSLGGQTAHASNVDWNPCGSSSGSAVAVATGIVELAVGTETDGSVICPSSINGIVGIKPTLGLVSSEGIIPIAHSQDTAGPMATSVRQAALLLAAMAGDGYEADGVPDGMLPMQFDFDRDALSGKRIGVLRSFYGSGSNDDVERVFASALATLADAGATLIDPIEIDAQGLGDAEYTVLLYEFKADLNRYLTQRDTPVASLADVIAFNEANADVAMPFFGQDILIESERTDGLGSQVYLDALSKSKSIAISGLLGAIQRHELDVLVVPSNGPAWSTDYENGDNFSVGSSSLAAVSGFPSITVPAGQTTDGRPLGISLIGRAWTDAELIEIAFAFEQLHTR